MKTLVIGLEGSEKGRILFPLAGVMRFQTERGLGAANVGAPAAAAAESEKFEAERAAEQFFRAVRRGHAGGATALLVEAHTPGAGLRARFPGSPPRRELRRPLRAGLQVGLMPD